MSDFERLLDIARPFKPFTVDIEGQVFHLHARKLSAIQAQEASLTWDEVYNTSLVEAEEDNSFKVLMESLKRQKIHTLANFIVVAEEQDLMAEADALLGGDSDPQTQEFKDKVDEVKQAREDELLASSIDDLMEIAKDRRIHYYALDKANQAMGRKLTQLTIFNNKCEPFFETDDAIKALPKFIVDSITLEAQKALSEGQINVNPLPSAGQRRPRKRTQLSTS